MDQYSKFFPPMLASAPQGERSTSVPVPTSVPAVAPQGEELVAAQNEAIRVRDARIEELEKKLAALSGGNTSDKPLMKK